MFFEVVVIIINFRLNIFVLVVVVFIVLLVEKMYGVLSVGTTFGKSMKIGPIDGRYILGTKLVLRLILVRSMETIDL